MLTDTDNFKYIKDACNYAAKKTTNKQEKKIEKNMFKNFKYDCQKR